jgi:enamine deaminase RidA (YjgF/YER057c/UK114 family)
MKSKALVLAGLVMALANGTAHAQRGGGGFGGGFGGMGGRGTGGPALAPDVPGYEVDGPPDSALATVLMHLKPAEASRYAQLRDSFMLATKSLRDSAKDIRTEMYARLDGGDRDAANYALEQLRRLGKSLKDQQNKFEDRLPKILTGDEMKDYKKWKKDQEQEAEDRQRADAARWRGRGGRVPGEYGGGGPGGMGGGFGGGYDRPVDQKATVETRAHAEMGSTVLRVGREVYIAGQVAVDSSGAIVGEGDLAAQARQAFANVTAALGAARAGPLDAVRLTIYVVNYSPKDLETVRGAAAAFLASRNPPVVTIVGVQSLSRPGLLISVEATALANIAR